MDNRGKLKKPFHNHPTRKRDKHAQIIINSAGGRTYRRLRSTFGGAQCRTL
jgi:hypothetical protein